MLPGLAILSALLVAAAPESGAEPPRLVNARVETRPRAGDLAATFDSIVRAQSGTAWLGYAVPIAGGALLGCCGSGAASADGGPGGCGCRLEEGAPGAHSAGSGPVPLEASSRLLVLFRVAAGRVGRLRILSSDCAIDGGGLPLLWLSDVAGAESVALLDRFVDAGGAEDSVGAQALAAIAHHADAAADRALIDAARRHSSRHVRGQALFWLARRAGRRAGETIARAVDDDPDVGVKQKAVFALSQLPRDEGVPLLIRTARTNRNAAVRREAMFWLGQSGDARALAFFEEVLTR